MKIAPFTIEQYFAEYEFTTPHNLCASDCESMTVGALLALAGQEPAALADLHLGYTESQGNPALRALVAANYPGVDPDQVIILTTPEEGIYVTMRALLSPGDHAVVMTPAYNSLLNVAEHVCGHVSRWEVQPTADGWALDLAALDRLMTPATRLLVVNFPHNPTGLLPDPATFQAIQDLAQKNGAWLFCDEMYRGLELDGRATLPSAAGGTERCVVLAGLSKVHGLPGLRSGWLIVPDAALRAALINWKHYTSICPPAPSEFLAAVALQVQPQLMARNREIIHVNLALATSFFARWGDRFRWRRPQAGSVALVGLEAPSATAYCHALAAAAGVLLLPGPAVGSTDQFVRWGFGRADFAGNLAHYEATLAETWPG